MPTTHKAAPIVIIISGHSRLCKFGLSGGIYDSAVLHMPSTYRHKDGDTFPRATLRKHQNHTHCDELDLGGVEAVNDARIAKMPLFCPRSTETIDNACGNLLNCNALEHVRARSSAVRAVDS
jgi:hypothetical protein